ncbi:MAG: glutathionylspermidine synthase family protein [Candidatus Hydrogenedentes bacterium]|nr:glutathionylspermidine synthase family protein [Candidatus Hydrogenedentota bacterium]
MRIQALAVEPGQFEALIEEMRFRYHKWDAYVGGTLRILPEALVLTPAEHEDAVACCTGIHNVLGKLEASILNEPRLMDRLGISAPVQEVMRAETPHPRGMSRYDLIPTASGWMAPEFNEDAPGGFNESIAGRALFAGLLPGATVPGDFARAFVDMLPPGGRAGLVYATGYSEDLQHVLILAALLRERGIEPVLASPSHLACGRFGHPRLLGKAVDYIIRFFPGEWYGYLENLRDWRRAVAKIPVINPLSRLVRQSKGLYALWREEALLGPEDTDLMNRHTPHTEYFRADRAAEYVSQREEWVLKRLYGRMGDAVTIGRLCPPNAWEQAVTEAARTPAAHIAQRAFTPVSVPDGTRRLFPALGVYLIAGSFAGYYSRADELGFTTHEAYYVVTAVKTP